LLVRKRPFQESRFVGNAPFQKSKRFLEAEILWSSDLINTMRRNRLPCRVLMRLAICMAPAVLLSAQQILAVDVQCGEGFVLRTKVSTTVDCERNLACISFTDHMFVSVFLHPLTAAWQ
jgi:hypothetical protein